MKVFVVAYCFGGVFGQTLIGVYKRALRVAHALCDRGHSVAFHCAGRENYHDDMTARAGQRMAFVDWPWREPLHEGAAENRRHTLAALRRAAPDVVVIGEAPLAGPLLEVTLAAVELELPVVCLDNAYGPLSVEDFCRHHGAMYDGIVLTGPRSFHAEHPPSYLLQVPPFLDPSPDEAHAFLAALGLSGRRVMTVLAYDLNVETLGASIVAKLERTDVHAVFLTHVPDACRSRLEGLPADVKARVHVHTPLHDRLHFGLLQQSRLVVGKCAFMQVSECLSLQTPIIGFHFQGDFHLGLIPDVCHPFAHQTHDAAADDETLTRARRFLDLTPAEMIAVHDGQHGAAAATVEYLERLPRSPRGGTLAESAALGLDPGSLCAALRRAHPGQEIELLDARMSALRRDDGQRVFSVLSRCRVAHRIEVERLWLRRFEDSAGLEAEIARAREPGARRTLLDRSAEHRTLIELDVGEGALPEAG